MDSLEELDQDLGITPGRTDFSNLPKQAIHKVRYSHDAMIDLVIANPWISQNEIAAHFGYTVGWVSQIFSADAFQSKMAARKNELIDPSIRATIEERFKALVYQSLDVLKRKLESPVVSDELALGALNGAAKALGYGARGPQVQVNQQFVVQVPGKAATSADWAKAHALPERSAELPALSPDTIPDLPVFAERVE